ncbi:NAD(P)-binding protein [Ramaria rubella]|nr:NAD(P)-binding protein [Ramaria rubella]
MPAKRIVVVTGATGTQGGSVVKFLQEDGTFIIRGITRNPESPAAKALSAKGVEIFKADFREPDSLIPAFTGAYGVFGVTNFWEYVSGAEEVAQGKALVDVAKKTGVKHFIWSSMDHSEYEISCCESKADVDDYLKASGVPRTSVYTSCYFENFTNLFRLTKNPSGSYDFPMKLTPDIPIPVYCANETGKAILFAWVLVAFKNPDEWLGKDLRVAAEFISARNMAKIISEVSGKPVQVAEINVDLTPRPSKSTSVEDLLDDKLVYLSLWHGHKLIYCSTYLLVPLAFSMSKHHLR